MFTIVIEHYKVGERAAVQKLINKLEDLGFKNNLILFDRGYPSRDFISFIESYTVKSFIYLRSL